MKTKEFFGLRRERIEKTIEEAKKELYRFDDFQVLWPAAIELEKVFDLKRTSFGTDFWATLAIGEFDSTDPEELVKFVNRAFRKLPPLPLVRFKKGSLHYEVEREAEIYESELKKGAEIENIQPWIIRVDGDGAARFTWWSALPRGDAAGAWPRQYRVRNDFLLTPGTIRFKKQDSRDERGRIIRVDYFPESDVILLDRVDKFWRPTQKDFNPLTLWWYRDDSMSLEDFCLRKEKAK